MPNGVLMGYHDFMRSAEFSLRTVNFFSWTATLSVSLLTVLILTTHGYAEPLTSPLKILASETVVSTPDSVSTYPRQPEPVAAVDKTPVLAKSVVVAAPELKSTDYQAILRYIKAKHPNIQKSNADLIAKAIVNECKRQKVDPKLVAALIAKESGFNHRATSRSGIKGLGQIMNYRGFNIQNPFDIKQSVRGTVAYLKGVLGKWQNHPQQIPLALASYHRGYFSVKRSGGHISQSSARYARDILKKYAVLVEYKKRFENN